MTGMTKKWPKNDQYLKITPADIFLLNFRIHYQWKHVFASINTTNTQQLLLFLISLVCISITFLYVTLSLQKRHSPRPVVFFAFSSADDSAIAPHKRWCVLVPFSLFSFFFLFFFLRTIDTSWRLRLSFRVRCSSIYLFAFGIDTALYVIC